MTCEYPPCHRARCAERGASTSNQRLLQGKPYFTQSPDLTRSLTHEHQIYVVCVTALLVYDYFLTLKDEVAQVHDDDDEKMP